MSDPRPIQVGDVIHGHACGVFGRDHYGCVKVTYATPEWAVFATFSDPIGYVFATAKHFGSLKRSRDAGYDPDYCKGSRSGCSYTPDWDWNN